MFAKAYFDEVAKQFPEAPEWPFETESVPYLVAYGPFEQTPEGPRQATNCRRALGLYLASRLTFRDFLRLQRMLVGCVGRRLGELSELCNREDVMTPVISDCYGWVALETVHGSVIELLKFMGKDVKDAENKRLFEQGPVFGTESMVDCFLGRAVLGADSMDKQAADLLGTTPIGIFETLVDEAIKMAGRASQPRPVQ